MLFEAVLVGVAELGQIRRDLLGRHPDFAATLAATAMDSVRISCYLVAEC